MAGDKIRCFTFQELIDDGVLEIGDGYRAKNEELGGNGPIFLRAGHVTDTHINFECVELFRADLAEKVQTKMARAGDTIITTKGNSTGRTSFVTERMPPFVYSPHLSYWRSRDPKQLANGFLRYWSRSSEFVQQLSGMKVSTDMAPYLSLTDQRRLKITLPAANEQKAIAHILGTLDDKIDLNRRMNQTLEAMARAVFKAWFIDFEPVKAKAAGATSFPGMPQPVFDQLPNQLTETELGSIPLTWSVKTVKMVCVFNYGKALKATNRRGGDVPVYGSNGQVGWHDEAVAHGPGIVVGRKGNPGTVSWVQTNFFPIDTTFYVTTDHHDIRLSYLRYALEHLRLDTFGSDSAVPGLNRNMAYGLPIVIPDETAITSFDDLFQLFQLMTHANEKESRTLVSIRDTLLPKLISGELQVPKAAVAVEEGAG